MNVSPWLIAILAIAVLLACARLRQSTPRWRRVTLMALQPICATLLYLTLLPPAQQVHGGTLVIAAAGSTASQLHTAVGEQAVALPEAPPLPGVERVPDLASALRHHSNSTRLRIVGSGLTARDRDVATGWPLTFAPAAPPSGLVELSTPPTLAAGSDFTVTGRAQGVPQGRVELIDPAGQRVDSKGLERDGGFSLSAGVRVAGKALFVVRLLDAQGRLSDHLDLPVLAIATPPLRLLVLAGAPQPELKYLRRWAEDAGLQLHTQIAVGGGLQLGDSPLPLDAPTLDGFDIALLDERAVGMLSHLQRQALRAAVERGLGLLLRTSGPVNTAQRAALRELGLLMQGDNAMARVIIESTHPDSTALTSRVDPRFNTKPSAASPSNEPKTGPPPMLDHLMLSPAAPDFAVLSRDAAGKPYAWWRALGQGRIGVSTVSNSYLLVLAGRPDLHAGLWSRSISSLTRPRTVPAGAAAPLDAPAWKGERVVLCSGDAQAHVLGADGTNTRLLADQGSGDKACATYWPRSSGWHTLVANGDSRPFFIRDPVRAEAFYTQTQRVATRALTGNAWYTKILPAPKTKPMEGPRWPWLLGLLVTLGATWWLERRNTPRISRNTHHES